ncbi:hypothetical protein [Fictibacillus phosphorivorans]|uniref:hypothetical protein n=1 Tax=Fictibacillus phosphorivorans TaxID=1221500 RepID=UPI0012939CDA|nr:hypothetical protein [Fictibacillus phosphorivorans]MQR94731.1 hypothetical protein [Fictibacillus phosphorivorans]
MTTKTISISLSILFISVLSLIFVGIDIAFPTTIIMVLLLSNAIFAFFSIFIQRGIMELYKHNFHTEKNGVISLINKYTTFAFFGLNYGAQSALIRLPLLINKLLSLLFFLLLLVNWLIILVIFNGLQ